MTRMPAPSAGIAIVMTYFSAIRAERGPKFCRKSLIGPLRARVETVVECGSFLEILDKEGVPGAYRSAMDDARAILAFHCKVCGRCKLGDGIMPPPQA